LIEHVHLKGLL